jgi:NADPH:quinone reductase-like Zn-dependent oxidoreductase
VSVSRLRLKAAARTADDISFEIATDRPALPAGDALVQIHTAAVNPSDAKAALGAMPKAVWPRTPGRDFSGIVIEGPAGWVGREVFGTGGDLGITRDGTHATHLAVPVAALCEIPAGVSLAEAGGIGVPFVTAWAGYQLAGLPAPGDVVLVLGANGNVGQAAMQIAQARGATAYGVARTGTGGVSFEAGSDINAQLRAVTHGHGADIVFNTVGSPYFADGCAAMAMHGRQIFIATIERSVPFDILAFYRGQHSFYGVDTLALDAAASGDMLRAMAPDFAAGRLMPFPIEEASIFSLDQAPSAYRSVLSGARARAVLRP